jgi:hypothetical protein
VGLDPLSSVNRKLSLYADILNSKEVVRGHLNHIVRPPWLMLLKDLESCTSFGEKISTAANFRLSGLRHLSQSPGTTVQTQTTSTASPYFFVFPGSKARHKVRYATKSGNTRSKTILLRGYQAIWTSTTCTLAREQAV